MASGNAGHLPPEHASHVMIADEIAGKWKLLRQLHPDGAMLVRPDGHIAWRCLSLASADPLDEPAAAGHFDRPGHDDGKHEEGEACGIATTAPRHIQPGSSGTALPGTSEQVFCGRLEAAIARAVHQSSSNQDNKLAARLVHDAMSKLLSC